MKLYLDENITPTLAVVLRGRGYDVLSAHEVGMRGKTDEEQLEYASSQGRILLTFNARHFSPLAQRYFEANREHFGIVVSKEVDLPEMIRLVVKLLKQAKAEELRSSFRWLQSYR